MVTGFEGFEVPKDKYHVITTPLVTNSGAVDVSVVDNRFAIIVTGSGVDIVDLFCGQVVSSGTIIGVETLCATAEPNVVLTGSLYVGTTAGIYTTQWSTARAPGVDFSSSLIQTYTTSTPIPISDDIVNDLAVVPSSLLVSTAAGVDYIARLPNSTVVSTRLLESGSTACYLTAAREGYWISTNSGVEVNYDLTSTTGAGIITVDFEYNASNSVPKLPSNDITDVFIGEGSPNTLCFTTTASGAFLIEESQGFESTSSVLLLSAGEGDTVSTALSIPAVFSSQGTAYVATTGSVTIFGLVNATVSGTHHQNISLADKFTKENTRDQALLSGTNTIIRTTNIA